MSQSLIGTVSTKEVKMKVFFDTEFTEVSIPYRYGINGSMKIFVDTDR